MMKWILLLLFFPFSVSAQMWPNPGPGRAPATGGGVATTNFLDEFSTLDTTTRWTSAVTGAGTVTISGGELTINDGGTVADAAAVWLKTPIDTTKRNQYWLAFRYPGDPTLCCPTVIRVANGVPALGANELADDRIKVEWQSTDRWEVKVYEPGHDEDYYQQETDSNWGIWSDVFQQSHTQIQENDYYVAFIETRPNGGTPQFRVGIYHKTGPFDGAVFADTNGYELRTLSPWKTFASLETASSGYYVVLGDADTDTNLTHMAYEWFAFNQVATDTLPDDRWGFVNRFEAELAFPGPYEIAAYYTLGDLVTGDRLWYVPRDQDPDVLKRGVQPASTIDDTWVSRPSVTKFGATYYMVYDCRSAANDNQICGATASAIEGPWTPATNNPLIARGDIGVNDDWKFPRIFYDSGQVGSEWRIWVNNENTGCIYFSSSAVFDSASWAVPTSKLCGSGIVDSWNEDWVAQPTWWQPGQAGGQLWVGGLDLSANLWRTGCYVPSNPVDIYGSTYSECAGNPKIHGSTTLATVSASQSGRTINVDTTANLRPGMWFVADGINAGGDGWISRVKAINSGTQFEAWHGVGNFGANTPDLRELTGFSGAITQLVQRGSKIFAYLTAFRWDGEETIAVYEMIGTDPASGSWQGSDTPWGTLPLEGFSVSTQLENLVVVTPNL